MKRILWFSLALYLLTVGQPALFASKKNDGPRVKKRIAVFLFADKTDKSWRWWNNKGVGQGVSDMLTTALVKTGNYRVSTLIPFDDFSLRTLSALRISPVLVFTKRQSRATVAD